MIIFFLLLFVLLLVPMLVVQFVESRMWSPSVKQPDMTDPDFNLDATQFNHDPSGYMTGDGSKFCGIMYACQHHTPWAEELWAIVKKFWDFDLKEFFRYDEPETGFSGDMFPGMAMAISVRDKKNLLTKEEKDFLGSLSWKLCITNLFPLKFSPFDSSRGHIWNPWKLSLKSVFQALIIMLWGIKFAPWYRKIVLSLLFVVFFVLHIPLFLFGMYDYNLFVGKTYACWWHGSHSSMITFAASYFMGIPFAKKGMKILSKRYMLINADVSSLSCALLKYREAYQITYSLVTDIVASRKQVPPTETTTYKDVKELPDCLVAWLSDFWTALKSWGIRKAFSILFHPSSYFDLTTTQSVEWVGGKQCQDYCWERSQLKRGSPGKSRGDLDIIFPLAVVNGCFDEFVK